MWILRSSGTEIEPLTFRLPVGSVKTIGRAHGADMIVDAALVSGLRAKETLSAALADPDPQVRKAALERLAAQKDKLEPAVIERTLALAVRDPNPVTRSISCDARA